MDECSQYALTSSGQYQKYPKGPNQNPFRVFTVIVDPQYSLYMNTDVLVQERPDLASGGGLKRIYGAAKLNH